jgi:hypothetical protein
MMSGTRQLMLVLIALVVCVLTSCQSDPGVRYANFPDAVTNINQVDPAYRKYFAEQQGRNYSAADQRKALAAAIRTARTPVPAYVPRTAMASNRKAMRQRTANRAKSRAVAKSKATRGRKAVARKSAKAPRKRAVAKRRSASRRRG